MRQRRFFLTFTSFTLFLPFTAMDPLACSQTPAAESAPIVQPGAPGQNGKVLSQAAATLPPRAPALADVSFMQGMIMHHAQAVEMTDLLRARSHDPAMQALGKRMSISQSDEIEFMKRWLEDRGAPVSMAGPMDTSHMDMSHMDHTGPKAMAAMGDMNMGAMPLMPGMLTPKQMEALAKATGPSFDHLFLTGMIQHHTGALIMVEDLFDTPGAGEDNVLYDFATDIDNTQSAEIKIMRDMLKERP
jgi:uncharacterized protein (DUF305 family)